MKAYYDYIVVGAGISGLYATRELLKRHPTCSIALAERYKGLGGRTYSYTHKNHTWEMGAGRIHMKHTHTMDLIKEYGLTWIPIGDSIFYKETGGVSIPNPFESISHIYIEPLKELNNIQNHTIESLMNTTYGPEKTKEILSYFPYRAEVTTMRADIALKTFFEGEMSSHKGYGVIKEGFSELVKRMREDIEARGCTVLQRHRLRTFTKSGKDIDCTFEFGYPDSAHGKILLKATHVILALHKDAVDELEPFRGWPVLKHLETKPLLRIYGVFDKPWVKHIERTVTPGPLRYIIPISDTVLMLSYTDADDTTKFMKMNELKLKNLIMSELRKLFPEHTIPDPTFFKTHPWTTGATYWLPGNYSPEALSKQAIHPLSTFPNVWLCGESWSMRQAWVEGALEHTILCLNDIERKR